MKNKYPDGYMPKIKYYADIISEVAKSQRMLDANTLEGGIFVRAVELKQFLELVEANENGNGGEVVGLRFEGNNLEIIVKK